MDRPVKWSRELHSNFGARRTRSYRNLGPRGLDELFGVSRATPQTLMKANGEVQPVGGTHFSERSARPRFLDAMVDAPDLGRAFRS